MKEDEIPKHHIKQELCTTRPSYRDGRRLTTVKVYTVHQESQYLLVQNVPAVGAKDQLAQLLSAYGSIAELHALDDFPAEPFTEVYCVKFHKIQSARFAKKKLDDHSFFGGSLHISYAPEYETVKETRNKLQDRRKVIAAKIRQIEKESKVGKDSQIIRQLAYQNGDQQSLPPVQTVSFPPQPHLELPPSFVRSHPTPTCPHRNTQHSADSFADSVVAHPPDHQPDTGVACSNFDDSTILNEKGTEHNNYIFTIPHPPLPGVNFEANHHRVPHGSHTNRRFACISSANATFPPGYDPRLPQERKVGGEHQETASIPDARVAGQNIRDEKQTGSVSSALVLREQTPGKFGEHSTDMHVTVNDKGACEKIVIKQYKPKGPTPRFLPRQVNKDKGVSGAPGTDDSQKLSTTKTREDEINQEIRKEAFRLGEEQGPTLPPDPKVRELLLGQSLYVDRQAETSVLTSVKAIRKRLSKFISETVPKKQKMTTAPSNKDTPATE